MTEGFDVDALIDEREKTHGDYLVNATITQIIKDALRSGRRYGDMHPAMKETLDMVAHKMHRIVNGDPYFKDHWIDMTGYPHLVVGMWDRIVAWHEQGEVQPSIPDGDDIYGILAFFWGGTRQEAKERALGIMRTRQDLSPAQQQMKEDMVPLAPGTRCEVVGPVGGRRIEVSVVDSEKRGGELWYSLEDAEGARYSRTASGVYYEPSELSPAAGSGGAGAGIGRAAYTTPTGGYKPGTPEDGGHHEPFSHEVEKKPILLTMFEYNALGNTEVGHGPQQGKKWQWLYDTSGERPKMYPEYVEEYGA